MSALPVAIDIVSESRELQIKSQAGYEVACDHLKTIKAMQAEALSKFEPMREKAYRAYEEVLKQKKSVMDPLEQAEKTLKSGIGSWLAEQERIRQEEERRAREEADRLHAEEIEAQIEEAERDGASIEEVAMIATQPMLAPTPITSAAVEKVNGVSARESWSAEIINPRLVLEAVLKGIVPIQAVQMNTAYFNQRARADKQALNIPGVRAVCKSGVAVRR